MSLRANAGAVCCVKKQGEHRIDTHVPHLCGEVMDILVIEDDPVIGKAIQRGMVEAGHECAWLKDGTQGLEAARSQKYDVVILDLLIPGEPGVAVLEKLRKEGIQT